MAREAFASTIWFTFRDAQGDHHEAYPSTAAHWSDAWYQHHELLSSKSKSDAREIVGFSWRLKGESPLDDSSHFGGVL